MDGKVKSAAMIKKLSYKKSYFQKHNTHRKNKIKVELDLSKYAKKI